MKRTPTDVILGRTSQNTKFQASRDENENMREKHGFSETAKLDRTSVLLDESNALSTRVWSKFPFNSRSATKSSNYEGTRTAKLS